MGYKTFLYYQVCTVVYTMVHIQSSRDWFAHTLSLSLRLATDLKRNISVSLYLALESVSF